MTETLPDGDVVHLPAPKHHQFGDHVRVSANKLLGRHAQTERTCSLCGLVKITVHPREGGGWREWREDREGQQIATDFIPGCDFKAPPA